MDSDDQQNRLHSNNRQIDGNPNESQIGGVGDIVHDTNTTMLGNLTERHHTSESTSTNHSFLFRNFNEHSNTGTRLTSPIVHYQGSIAQHVATNRMHLGGSSQARYTPTDTSRDDDILARYLLLNRLAEQIPMNRQQVLSSQQIAFLQIEEMRLNLSSRFISQPAFPSFPFDATIHPYQQHQLINSALQQLNQVDTSLQGIASMQRQSGHIPLVETSPFSNARHIWVDPTATSAHFQHNAVVNNRQPSNERAVVMSPLQRLASIQFPMCIAHSDDKHNLSSHQQYLRLQIEVFQADEEDVRTYVRGRNRPIQVGQIGIRCRHCVHVNVAQREKGSTYYPAQIIGIYQAAQNMSTSHIQCGRCPSMPTSVKEHFKYLLATKSLANGAGRSYWADKVREEMNLIDMEYGIFPAL